MSKIERILTEIGNCLVQSTYRTQNERDIILSDLIFEFDVLENLQSSLIMETDLDESFESGMSEGYEEGVADGRADGYEEGYEVGVKEGLTNDN